jgi:hypothetical protein
VVKGGTGVNIANSNYFIKDIDYGNEDKCYDYFFAHIDLFSVYPQPGVDVMITIFCDFRQFSAKK